jgi:ribosomal-protein-alanine N-acetyltransferase
MEVTFKALNAAAAREILSWEYEPPYDIYNLASVGEERAMASFLNAAHRYHRIEVEEHGLIGFCCFGPEARVPGGDYGADQLDIGLGLRPDLTGRGLGPVIIARVCEFARRQYGPRALRVTIASFNRRARRAWETSGFEFSGEFNRSTDGEPFVQLSWGDESG